MVARVPVKICSFPEKSGLKNEVNCGKPNSQREMVIRSQALINFKEGSETIL